LLFSRLSESSNLRSVTIDLDDSEHDACQSILDEAPMLTKLLLEPFNKKAEDKSQLASTASSLGVGVTPNIRFNGKLPVQCSKHRRFTYVHKCECCNSVSNMCCKRISYQTCDDCERFKVCYQTISVCYFFFVLNFHDCSADILSLH
jgi:hypothetical protein